LLTSATFSGPAIPSIVAKNPTVPTSTPLAVVFMFDTLTPESRGEVSATSSQPANATSFEIVSTSVGIPNSSGGIS
jgi:hypothetical protein